MVEQQQHLLLPPRQKGEDEAQFYFRRSGEIAGLSRDSKLRFPSFLMLRSLVAAGYTAADMVYRWPGIVKTVQEQQTALGRELLTVPFQWPVDAFLDEVECILATEMSTIIDRKLIKKSTRSLFSSDNFNDPN